MDLGRNVPEPYHLTRNKKIGFRGGIFYVSSTVCQLLANIFKVVKCKACGYVADKIRRLCSGKSGDEKKEIKGIKERPCVISNGIGPKARPAFPSPSLRSGSLVISSVALVCLAASLTFIVIPSDNSMAQNQQQYAKDHNRTGTARH